MTDHDIVHKMEQWLRNEPLSREVIAVRLEDDRVRVTMQYGDRTSVESTMATLRAALVDCHTKAMNYPSASRKKRAMTVKAVTPKGLPGTPKGLPGVPN